MNPARLLEFCFSCVAAFVVLILISFLTLRPMLRETGLEARAEWDAFRRAVAERNELLPGMVEGLRGFQPGVGKLTENLLEARAISMRATDRDSIMASVDVMDGYLNEIGKVAECTPGLDKYLPFATLWKKAQALGNRISLIREDYIRTSRLYNKLLTVFPQNLLAALFGFVPMKEYPSRRGPS